MLHKHVAVALVLIVVVAGCGSGDESGASKTPGPIVFSARPDAADASGWQLFVANADGSGLRRLTHTDGDVEPTWSPGGTRVVFSRGDGEVWLIDRSGENERRLARGYPGSWSPDGQEIAFTRSVGEESSEIALINVDGSDERTLITNASAPVWSPDGDRILFETGELYEERIGVMQADGSEAKQLTKGPGDSCAQWSPDGEKIAFCSGRDGEIYVMSSDGSDVRRVSRTKGSEDAYVLAYPVWSPDSEQIAFTTLGENVDSEVIAVVGADGRNQRTLSPDPASDYTTDSDPVWSPDGEQIVFVNGNAGLGGELWVMNADGSGRHRFISGPFTEPDQGLSWAASE